MINDDIYVFFILLFEESQLAQALSSSSDWCLRHSKEAAAKGQLEEEVSALKLWVHVFNECETRQGVAGKPLIDNRMPPSAKACIHHNWPLQHFNNHNNADEIVCDIAWDLWSYL